MDEGMRIQSLVKELDEELKALVLKGKRNVIITCGVLFVVIALFIIPTKDLVTTKLILTILGLVPVYAIGIIISSYFARNEFKKSLLRETISMYNIENNLKMNHEYKPVQNYTFNDEMGMFNRWASSVVDLVIDIDETTSIILCKFATNSGYRGAKIEQFNGVYIIFRKPGYGYFHIRTTGKPDKGSIKLKKTVVDGDIIYKPTSLSVVNIDYKKIFTELSKFDDKYISSNNKEIHIAYAPRSLDYGHEEVSQEKFHKYYEKLQKLMNQVFEIKLLLEEVKYDD